MKRSQRALIVQGTPGQVLEATGSPSHLVIQSRRMPSEEAAAWQHEHDAKLHCSAKEEGENASLHAHAFILHGVEKKVTGRGDQPFGGSRHGAVGLVGASSRSAPNAARVGAKERRGGRNVADKSEPTEGSGR